MKNRKCLTNFAILACLVSAACSLYQSESREFLEKQAFQFASTGVATKVKQKQGACVETEDLDYAFFSKDMWKLLGESFSPSYKIFEPTSKKVISFVVALQPNKWSSLFVCEYVYSSGEEREELRNKHLHEALSTVEDMSY